MSRLRKSVCALLAVLLGFPNSVGAAPAADADATGPETIGTMVKMAENGALALYLDPDTTEIAVRRKDTGAVWRSNPAQREEDPVAQGAAKWELGSQLVVHYYANGEILQTMDNFSAGIRHDQFVVEPTEDGVRVTYEIGKNELGRDAVPTVFGKERFEQTILPMVAEEDRAYLKTHYKLVSLKDAETAEERKALLEQYPSLEKTDVYALSKYFPDFEIPNLYALLQKSGYTREDLARDNEENGIVTERKAEPRFRISIDYALDGDHLVVTVPLGEMEYEESFPPYSIEVLKYFGAADSSRQGYMFVPDGSGALIYLNNGKRHADAVSLPVYGTDLAIRRVEETYRTESVALPVFGLKADDSAFLAMLEDGEAHANIAADIAGRRTSYHHVYARFVVRPRDEVVLETGNGQKRLNVFQQRPYDGDLRLRFAFLSGPDADYSGMAAAYREHLEATGVLKRRMTGGDIPFFLELTGAIRKKKSFLGIRYHVVEPLTTYSQAADILRELLDAGVRRIALRYAGWFNGGLAHSLPTRISLERKLGGKKAFAELSEFAAERGIELFPDAAFLNVYRNTRGFRPGRDAVRYLNKDVAALYRINPASFVAEFQGAYRFLLSPLKLGKVVDRFLKAFLPFRSTMLAASLFLRDLGSDLYSDFRSGKQVDRQRAKQIAIEQLRAISDSGVKIGMNRANAYALPYADIVLNAPTDSSRYFLTDVSVPFYQMVVRGYLDYAGEPINSASDARTAMLRTVETGGGVHFSWIYADNTKLKKTDHNDMFRVHYAPWLQEAAAFYRKYNESLRSVQGQTIARHELIGDKVRRTTFEDGTSVLVNYGDAPVTVGGVVVPAMDFAVERGGAEQE